MSHSAESSPVLPGVDPLALVAPSLRRVEGWVRAYGERTAFRVRGLEWFRASVQKDIDKLKPLIPAMEDVRLSRPCWTTSGVDWDQKFSITQVYSARQKEPLKFGKAAKVILLCEVAAADAGMPADIVHSRMRIEPALFGIADLTPELLKTARREKENLNAILRRGTQQSTATVFDDMANGLAVSYRLAWLTRSLLRANVPSVPWDDVIILPDRSKKPRYMVSKVEEIEGPSVPGGAPDPFNP